MNGSVNKQTAIRILLICGILSSVLYIGTDIIAAMSWRGYSYADQMFSELLAIGSPPRPFMIASSLIYNFLVIAFGTGVLMASGRKRSLKIAGLVIIVYGAISGAGPFVPIHQRGTEVTLTDILRQITTIAIVLSIVLYIGFGAFSQGKGFRIYSAATVLVIFTFGILAGMQASKMEAGMPTPWFGIIERANIYGAMLWVLFFAYVLLRDQHNGFPGQVYAERVRL